MNSKINLIKPDGTSVQVDVICSIENIQSGKRYLYYTLNEIVGAGASSTVKIYVSKINQGNPQLDAAINEIEWENLKNIMGDVLRGNANPDIKYVLLTDLTNITSVSDRVIAMPTSYDYITKHRGVYAQAIATMEPTAPVAIAEEIDATAQAPIVEPVPTINPAPQVEEPIVEPTITETAVIEPKIVPAEEPLPISDTPITSASEPSTINPSSNATPIDISEIEKKNETLMNDLIKLKEQEIEAVKRYNATLELSSMHNAQHANYVESENNKELNKVAEPLTNQSPVIEPATVATIVPEPENKPQAALDLETNWFDMPTGE